MIRPSPGRLSAVAVAHEAGRRAGRAEAARSNRWLWPASLTLHAAAAAGLLVALLPRGGVAGPERPAVAVAPAVEPASTPRPTPGDGRSLDPLSALSLRRAALSGRLIVDDVPATSRPPRRVLRAGDRGVEPDDV